MSKQQVSRRQFLTYTIMGVGGFMAASTVMPMLRMAVDPVLQAEAGGDFIATNVKVDELTNEPTRVDFQFDQEDGWYKSKVTETAWVYKDQNGEIVALSPICKHLGCTVSWNTSEEHQNKFFCPCHRGVYEKDGKNVPGTPPRGPLDRYHFEVRDGVLYLSRRASAVGGA